MRRIRPDTWLALGLLLLMVVVMFAAAMRQAEKPQEPPLSSYSNAPGGARALRLWLQTLKFTVREPEGSGFDTPDGTRLILMLEPSLVEPDEWRLLDRFVKDGGVLLIAGGGLGANLAAEHFDFDFNALDEPNAPVQVHAPVMSSPQLPMPTDARPEGYYTSKRSDYVAHFGVEQGPVVVSFNRGQGRVILCAASFPFSNEGLKQPGNPEWVLHLLSGAFRSVVWFDEWHHGKREAADGEVVGVEAWIRGTPPGQALLLALGILFVALALSGKAFGRPLQPQRAIARRAPLEYITALAHLSQRAGHRRAVMHLYYTHLKRELGRRYRLDPSLDDRAYAAALAQMRPEIQQTALLSLLLKLHSVHISEREMLRLADEVDRWLQQEPGA
jgi:hypothetical protein